VPAAAGAVAAAALAGATAAPVVDTTAPKTTMQVKLADGRKLRLTLNLTHTVRDVQALIAKASGASAPYVLLAGFPPAALADASATVTAAGLQGAQLTQKLVVPPPAPPNTAEEWCAEPIPPLEEGPGAPDPIPPTRAQRARAKAKRDREHTRHRAQIAVSKW
jgi:hypothetical protein